MWLMRVQRGEDVEVCDIEGIQRRVKQMLIVQQEYLRGTQVCIIKVNGKNDASNIKITINELSN